jgi:hypothetical protein
MFVYVLKSTGWNLVMITLWMAVVRKRWGKHLFQMYTVLALERAGTQAAHGDGKPSGIKALARQKSPS